MDTPELINYFMRIPSELKEEITREFDKDVNTHLLPKIKEMTHECGVNTLKRLADGIKKNTIYPEQNTRLTHSCKTTPRSTQLAHARQQPEKVRLLKTGSLYQSCERAADSDVPHALLP